VSGDDLDELTMPCSLCKHGPRSTGGCEHLISLSHDRVVMPRSVWKSLVEDRLAYRLLHPEGGPT
jgi:hypothetical protein